jgi:hypothetical protein
VIAVRLAAGVQPRERWTPDAADAVGDGHLQVRESGAALLGREERGGEGSHTFMVGNVRAISKGETALLRCQPWAVPATD